MILVDFDSSKLDELSKKYEGSVAFKFDFKRHDDWKDYQCLCNRISKTGEISMLVNAVEEFD